MTTVSTDRVTSGRGSSQTKRRIPPSDSRQNSRMAPPRNKPQPPRTKLSGKTRARSAPAAAERSNPRAPFVMLVLALVVSGMVGLVLLNTAINEEAFELHQLSRNKKSMDLQEQQLQRDVAELESAGALHAAAKRQNLVDAGPPAFIDLKTGQVLGVPKPAGS